MDDLIRAAADLAQDGGLLTDHGLRSLRAAAAYATLSGLGDTAELLRDRGADPGARLSDAALLRALAALADTIRAEWAAVGVDWRTSDDA